MPADAEGLLRSRRAFDVFVAGVAVVLSAPLWPLIAAAIRLETNGPVLHRAVRVGAGGEPFELLKFRSMVVGAANAGAGITAAGDARVTRVGRVLRSTKLDELPQLINVLRGDMSIVGPRPEDPRYVAGYSVEQREILVHRPGITSPATVEFRHEEQLLAAAADPEEVYRAVVLPQKLAIDREALARRSLRGDIRVIIATLRAIWSRSHVGGTR